MVREKKTKTASLVLTAILLFLNFIPIQPRLIGLYDNAPVYTRFTYHFFHDGWIHTAANCWCLLSVVFIYDISLARLLVSYLIASSYPFEGEIPTIGLSGICFALIGSISFQVRDKLIFHTSIGLSMALGFLFPQINTWLHLYCYIAGLVVGCLNRPVDG